MATENLSSKIAAGLSAIVAMPESTVAMAKEAVHASNQASINLQHKVDIAETAMKAAPPVTVVGASAAGVQINEVIMWATLVYLILQIGFLLYKWIRLHNETSKTEDKE
jgi:hypothetical protein